MSGNIKFRWFLLASIVLSFLTSCATTSQLNNRKSWANIDGFRSAKFGMKMKEVKEAIHQNFGIPDGEINAIMHPTERTESLGITVKNLLPNAGKARIVYVFGYKSKRLIQINILIGRQIDTSVTPQQVVDTGNLLGNDFFKNRYQKDGLVAHARLDDGSILIFRGKDQKGRMALLRLSNSQPNNKNTKDLKISLSLSYIEKPGQPDAYQLGGFADAQTPRPSQPSSPALPPVAKAPPQSQQPSPQSGTGSGFFVSKMGHVITNAHVVQNCNKVTIGDNANKQVPAEVVNTDKSNDLALLKLSTLEMASTESKSLIQKLGIAVVPLATNGLLRNEDVKLGEKVLVAGYPFGDAFSNTIKVTSGIVSATRGAGDDSGQFQLDAAVQPGNSGGPIYDSGGNIVGVVISQLDKLKMAKAIGSLPENVNFGIKASTVRQFLISSGLPSKKSERTEEKSTEQLAEIAKNQALMVMCLQ